jgi:ABC-type nitrate/sulfonate/bicarbonate transport system substrate-binding protein
MTVKARIGIINRTINMLDFLMADHGGIYAHHGIEPTFDTLAGKESIDALIAGDLDFVVSIGAAVRAIMQDDAPIKVGLLVHRNAPHWLMASARIVEPADLKGRKVQAAQPGSEPDVMVQKWLTAKGLDPQADVELVYERVHVGWTEDSPDPKEDAVIARTLEQEVLEAKGFHTLVDLCEEYPNTLVHGLIVTERTLINNPNLLDSMVAAHGEIASWIDEGRPEVLEFIQTSWDVKQDRAARAIHALKGKFVARFEASDFGPVIESSAIAVGAPPIEVKRLMAERPIANR